MILSAYHNLSTLRGPMEAKQQVAIRRTIRNAVDALHPFDRLESHHREDVLSWIESGADLFRITRPDVPRKHLVSYFVLIDPVQKSMLLVDHIKAQLWLPTGGHVELNENPKKTVEREVIEELRIKAVFLNNNDTPFFVTVTETGGLTPGHVDVSLWYLLKGNVHEFIDFDRAEFNDIEWFSFDEILQSDSIIFDPHLQRFTRKLIDYLA
jgi:8-oxo-dGTP diphosphatase